MYDRMEELVNKGEYQTKADLIRDAIQKLIDWELKLDNLPY